ncbi:MAG TPA: RodZ domain-containing protein [Herpetosiphonaceae bacterium]
MSQLGARFREAREARGITLNEASASTRILLRYLQALEEGDFNQLPGDVYARGFIRNYAQFLDLPADELILLYRRERGAPTDRIKVVPAAVPPRTRSCLIPSAFVSFFAILVLLGVLYLVAQAAGLMRPTTITLGPTVTPAVPTATQFPTATFQPSGTPPSPLPPAATPTADPALPASSPNPAASPAASPGASPTPGVQAPLVVEVRIAPNAARGSWMTVAVDGRTDYTGTLLANASKTFQAQREVFLHVGDASAVELIVNGQSRGLMGSVRGGTAKETIRAPEPTGSRP